MGQLPVMVAALFVLRKCFKVQNVKIAIGLVYL